MRAPAIRPAQITIMNHITKEQFVALLDSAGVTEQQKHQFHAAFEKRHPDAHERFLAWLGIAPDEIDRIRARSRQG